MQEILYQVNYQFIIIYIGYVYSQITNTKERKDEIRDYLWYPTLKFKTVSALVLFAVCLFQLKLVCKKR